MNRLKSQFVVYFDGCYGIDPTPGVANTFAMGVCKLEHDEEANTLTVHLRRPGLLIGKAGSTLNKAEEYLDCKILVKEVVIERDDPTISVDKPKKFDLDEIQQDSARGIMYE